VVHVVIPTGSGKRQVRPSTYHVERLLEEACPNHVSLVKHKLRDCGMKLDDGLDEGDAMPFLGRTQS
jgi:hypothetical protein